MGTRDADERWPLFIASSAPAGTAGSIRIVPPQPRGGRCMTTGPPEAGEDAGCSSTPEQEGLEAVDDGSETPVHVGDETRDQSVVELVPPPGTTAALPIRSSSAATSAAD